MLVSNTQEILSYFQHFHYFIREALKVRNKSHTKKRLCTESNHKLVQTNFVKQKKCRQTPRKLRQLCVQYIRKSKYNKDYALAMHFGHIAKELYNPEIPNSCVIFIAMRCVRADGDSRRGICCGFDVSERKVVFGYFEKCFCEDTRRKTRWIKNLKTEEINTSFVEDKKTTHISMYIPWLESVSTERCRLHFEFLFQRLDCWLVRHSHLLEVKASDEIKRMLPSYQTLGQVEDTKL